LILRQESQKVFTFLFDVSKVLGRVGVCGRILGKSCVEKNKFDVATERDAIAKLFCASMYMLA
jgi:hypothetical protein